MDTSRFLESVLAKQGHYCLFAAQKGTEKRVQKFFTTPDDLIKAGEKYDSNSYDTYFALATFVESGARKVDNIAYLNALFIDVDCGPNKKYQSKSAAFVALRNFCKSLYLPQPWIVDSGRGIHAYWPLRESVSYSMWLPVAEKLKAKCLDMELHADPPVTADGARVLRLPETHNYKEEDALLAKIINTGYPDPIDIDVFDDLLGDVSVPIPTVRSKAAGGDNTMDALAGYTSNIRSRFRTILQKTAKGKGCAQLLYIFREQEECPEPLWRAGLSIANKCVEREKAAHKLSNKHPEYSPEETIRKMELTEGPYRCDTFADLNPELCEGCPNRGKIASPIVLGHEIEEAEESDNIVSVEPTDKTTVFDYAPPNGADGVINIPTYPKPYFRGKHGGVYLRKRGEDGDVEEVMIYPYDLYTTGRIRDPDTGECAVIRVHLPHDGMREFTVPLSTAVSTQELNKVLASEGIISKNMRAVTEYIMDWLRKLQESTAAVDARIQFGWTENMRSFVLGDTEYTERGLRDNPPSTHTIRYMPYFKTKGTLEGWKEMISTFNVPGMEVHQIVVCTGFGSILMEFMPNVHAGGKHIYSKDTGFGKTTGLFAAASIWGNYEQLIVHAKDTINFTMRRGDVYKSLPLLVDELTNRTPEHLSDFVLALSQGRDKGRMQGSNSDERTRGNPWSLLAVSTGNTSVGERISMYKSAALAEAQRILEVPIKRFSGKLDYTLFNTLLTENYGHAGPIFVEWVVKNKSKVQDLLTIVQRTVDKTLGLTYQNRYWSADITCTITGGLIARKLGLIEFDMDKILKEFKRIVLHNSTLITSLDRTVEEVINDYVTLNWNNFLIIESTAKGISGTNVRRLPVHDMGPKGKMAGRYEYDTQQLFLVITPFKAWCINQQINYADLTQTLAESYNGKTVLKRLDKGTSMSLPPARALQIDGRMFKDIELDVPDVKDGTSDL